MAKLGTFKVGDNSVTLSRGRGSNKAVILDVSFKDLERWARQNAIDEQRLFARSYGRACTSVQRKLQKVVAHAGGVEGVPKFKDFEAFTQELRAIRHRTTPMGGILAEPHVIVKYRLGDKQIIGWPERVAEWAVRFQDGVPGPDSERMFTTPEGRCALHRKGIKYVPREYVSNPRRVLPEPFGREVDRYLDRWAKEIYYKDLAKQMAKQKFT